MRLLLILLALPVVEIALFIEVGGWIGLWPTLGLVVLAALAGGALIRHQGLRALDRLSAALAAGGRRGEPILHGALKVVAGVLLLVPGFFTDAVGLLLLVPAVRARMIDWGAARLTVQEASYVRPRHGETIVADYEIVEDRPAARPERSGWTRLP